MKKIFKVLTTFITVATLTVLMFAVNVSAASVSISGGGEYEVGKSFSVTVRFNADANLYAVEADISYNSSVLRLDGVSGADYTSGNGSIKIVDDGFSAARPSKTSSYTMKFTAVAAGNSPISATMLGGGDATSKAAASAAIKVVTPKPSSNANLSSIKLSSGSLSPAFNPNTTTYNVTVPYSVNSVTITGAVSDGSARYTGGGTFTLQEGNNQRVLTVTAQDGTKKSYTVNIKRMTEQETADAEKAARDADPLLAVIDGSDYRISNDLSGISLPAGFEQGTATRKDTEIPVFKDQGGRYTLYWLTDSAGENGAFYTCDENDNFTRVNYINANGKMYIIEPFEETQILPAGYIKAKCGIDGIEVDAIGYEDVQLKDFYILNCYVEGENKIYRFDSVEGTLQRAAEFDLAVSAIKTGADESEKTPSKILSWFKNLSKTGKAVLLICAVSAVAVIVLIILLIIKLASSGKDGFDDDGRSIILDTDISSNPEPENTVLNTDGLTDTDVQQPDGNDLN